MRRRLLTLSLLVALPTVLLAFGWFRASAQAHDVLVQDQRNRLAQAIQTTGARIEEQLEELRSEEDERPFYLYNHYYSPPDVMAVSDPVALSPLAGEPSDARVLGYFQVEPGGVLRTPYSTGEEGETYSERETNVREAVLSQAFIEDWALWLGSASSEILGDAPAERSALTTGYREWGNALASDIQLAQQGSSAAQNRVFRRGHSAPQTSRNTIGLSSSRSRPLNRGGMAGGRNHETSAAGALGEFGGLDERVGPAPSNGEPVRGRRGQGPMTHSEPGQPAPNNLYEPDQQRPSTPSTPNHTWAAPAQSDTGATVSELQAARQDIDYTQMRWTHPGSYLALQRVVVHEGVPVVQGVLFDRGYVYDEWLGAQVRTHTPAEYTPRLIASGDPGECTVREQVSASLNMDICFPNATLDRLTATFEREHTIEMLLVSGLLVLVLFALFAVIRASTRSEQLAKQQADFVSAVSHELRTPLTTLRMHAEMLEENMVSESRLPQVHRQLVAESVRLARLVDNVLEVSRLDGGQRQARMQRSDLGAHIEEVVDGQRSFLKNKGLDVIYVGPEEPTEVLFDPQAMEQTVVNLLDNAAKYAATKEEPFEVHLIVDEDSVTLSVRDRGPGIPEALRRKVFERFYRVERPETAHTPGTGIGLSLVHSLALAQGGQASVHTRPGGGADVRVTLPLRQLPPNV